MCGIFGVYNARKAAELTVIGLHAIQHRAIDFAGIVSTDGQFMYRERGPGLARQVFTKDVLDRLHGKSALGHIRYPTVSDNPKFDNIQPILGNWKGIPFALAHNGNLTNVDELLATHPIALATSMDSEIIVRLIERSLDVNFDSALVSVLRELRGSFSLGILLPNRLIAVRDGQGNRPLSIGHSDDSYFLSSETCAFPNVETANMMDVEPGTVVTIDQCGARARHFKIDTFERRCRFEGIYFSHPSSFVYGESITQFRISVGRELERLLPVEGGADIVTPIPDSASFIAMGYGGSGDSGRFFPVILRNHYVGRTFIAATQAQRDEEVSQKFTFSSDSITGKRIVVVDDSIVRGTTLIKIVGRLRALGAKAVHVRIGSPPITHPCRYGINTRTEKELISASCSPKQICETVGADSLGFLPLEALKRLSGEQSLYCWACMTGEYW